MDLHTTIERGKREILADVKSGAVPATAKDFAELHDYVDANYYGGAFEAEFDDSDRACAFWNKVQDTLDAWIRSGAMRREAKTP